MLAAEVTSEMAEQTGCTVGEAARIAHVSVRTLHHYDEIGLLVPSARSTAGYRLYSREDLERLHQILLYRELGLPLAEIRRIVADPGFDRREALRAQRAALAAQARRTEALLASVERALQAIENGVSMSDEELFEVFGEEHRAYQEEARERWGATDAYKESARRTRHYTKADWEEVKAESEAIGEKLVRVYRAGRAPGDPETQAVIERHRQQIERRFYPISRAMHAELGRMYVADPRFRATYESMAEGLAQFVCDATAWAAEHESEQHEGD